MIRNNSTECQRTNCAAISVRDLKILVEIEVFDVVSFSNPSLGIILLGWAFLPTQQDAKVLYP